MASFSYIEYTVEKRVAFITLNRPDKRNALNAAMVTELKEAFESAGKDATVKLTVLRANGEAFSAGADLEDLRRLQKNSFEENLADSRHLMELYHQIYFHSKLTIAQVEGPAVAGGCGLATICDLCYSIPGAKFGYPEVRIGFIPALVSVFLVHKIGEGKARELLLTGKLITAEAAAAMGLINGVVEKAMIRNKVREMADEMAVSTAAHAVELTKKLIANSLEKPFREALEEAAILNAEARASEDCKKGIRAFLNRERLTW